MLRDMKLLVLQARLRFRTFLGIRDIRNGRLESEIRRLKTQE
jgi:hypothetical protein